ncbi:peptide chain release factor N(5)-glutamine methyltransferase [Butyrivibrio sp. AE2032]|uniref:peptide chain release factor N(5)-glutamine methyltransferase n=1 Tax=Butyrivibrio sp. AE2032 TaxID=1458463 RepID=UPI00068F6CC9|nr:peptide chain release factor N(5)-glutamine methyltransferase [Butyrivibrio sp. AE2032]
MTSGNDRLLAILKEAGDDEASLDLDILSGELEGKALEDAVKRRAEGEPLAYILGYRHFFKECYKVRPGVLIPRADTETVVEAALKFFGINDLATGDLLTVPSYGKDITDIRFADLCTGSGCIGISLANEIVRSGGKAEGCLIDISDNAIETSKDNVKTQALKPEDIKVLKHDVLKSVPELGKLDIIVSNPPYITDAEMEELDSVVKDHEPDLALRAGADGLLFYPYIIRCAKELLRDGGALMAEHGYAQGDAVRELFGQGGLKDCLTIRDYGNNPRVTIGFK